MTAFLLRARSRTAATSRAVSLSSGRRQIDGMNPDAAAASVRMVPPRDPRPAVRLHRARARGEQPPELLPDEAGDRPALGEPVIARNRLEHLEVLAGSGEAADHLVARHRHLAPRARARLRLVCPI